MQLIPHICNLGVLMLILLAADTGANGSLLATRVHTPPWMRRNNDPHPRPRKRTRAAVQIVPASVLDSRRFSLPEDGRGRSFLGAGEQVRSPAARRRRGRRGRRRRRLRNSLRRTFRPRRHALLTRLKRGIDELAGHLERVRVFNFLAGTALNEMQTALTTRPLQCDDFRLFQVLDHIQKPLRDARKFRRRVEDSMQDLTEAIKPMDKMRGSTLRAAVEEGRTHIQLSGVALRTTKTLVDKLCGLCPTATLCKEAPQVKT